MPSGPRGDDDLADILRRLTADEAALVATPSVGAATTRPVDAQRPERVTVAVVESEGGIGFDPEFASFGSRLVGLLIDSTVLSLLTAPGAALAATGSGIAVVLGVLLAVAGFGAAAAWYGRSVARTGQWVGARVAKTRVVDARNGRNVSTADGVARFVVRFVISPVLLFGFLMALTKSDRRTFHDLVVGTVVIGRPRETWSIGETSIGDE